jgi:hypothetical protein
MLFIEDNFFSAAFIQTTGWRKGSTAWVEDENHGQKQVKGNQRSYVDEQSRASQACECVPDYHHAHRKRLPLSVGDQAQNSVGIGFEAL